MLLISPPLLRTFAAASARFVRDTGEREEGEREREKERQRVIERGVVLINHPFLQALLPKVVC
jgi:hypothetical protein